MVGTFVWVKSRDWGWEHIIDRSLGMVDTLEELEGGKWLYIQPKWCVVLGIYERSLCLKVSCHAWSVTVFDNPLPYVELFWKTWLSGTHSAILRKYYWELGCQYIHWQDSEGTKHQSRKFWKTGDSQQVLLSVTWNKRHQSGKLWGAKGQVKAFNIWQDERAKGEEGTREVLWREINMLHLTGLGIVLGLCIKP